VGQESAVVMEVLPSNRSPAHREPPPTVAASRSSCGEHPRRDRLKMTRGLVAWPPGQPFVLRRAPRRHAMTVGLVQLLHRDADVGWQLARGVGAPVHSPTELISRVQAPVLATSAVSRGLGSMFKICTAAPNRITGSRRRHIRARRAHADRYRRPRFD
jgi:hypothetical protein